MSIWISSFRLRTYIAVRFTGGGSLAYLTFPDNKENRTMHRQRSRIDGTSPYDIKWIKTLIPIEIFHPFASFAGVMRFICFRRFFNGGKKFCDGNREKWSSPLDVCPLRENISISSSTNGFAILIDSTLHASIRFVSTLFVSDTTAIRRRISFVDVHSLCIDPSIRYYVRYISYLCH